MTPIALFTYNRSQNLQRTLDCLKKNKIDLLYIFSDGPKNEADAEKIKKVREILDQIDWVKTEKTYHEKNLGLSDSILFGVNKVLDKHETIICIEDDVCVADGFYKYMEACLEKYKNNNKIAGVTGLRYPAKTESAKDYSFDTFLFPRFSSWGWGTWRRFWQATDFDRKSLTKKIKSTAFNANLAGDDMKENIKKLISGKLYGGWDVFCAVNMLLNEQVFVWPTWNMIENSGLTEGTHARSKSLPWKLRWEYEKSPQNNTLRFPDNEKDQEEIKKSFLTFFSATQTPKPEWKTTILMSKKILKKTIKKILDIFGLKISRARVASDKKLSSYSQLDEQAVIQGYLGKLKELNKYCVDIAASDGVRQSNTYALYLAGWAGLAVECVSSKFARLADTYQVFTNVNLSKTKVTPENVIDLLKANEVPKNFGMLNLDIDSYDYFVLEKILSSYRPSLLCVEINEKIPTPIKFAVNFDPNYEWAVDAFYGQSLSQVCALTSLANYDLIELHYNNAIFIPKELNFTKALTPDEAYHQGYLDKPDRKEKFPWNASMEDVLHLPPEKALEFLKKYFYKYTGKFTISL